MLQKPCLFFSHFILRLCIFIDINDFCRTKKEPGQIPTPLKSNKLDYLRVTCAPTSSSLALISSASSLATPSLITDGAPSTKPLASLRPRPVTSLTTLITLTLPAPADVNSTSNSVFSSAAPAAAPAAATGAAAETPNSSSIAFTKSFNSRIQFN